MSQEFNLNYNSENLSQNPEYNDPCECIIRDAKEILRLRQNEIDNSNPRRIVMSAFGRKESLETKEARLIHKEGELVGKEAFDNADNVKDRMLFIDKKSSDDLIHLILYDELYQEQSDSRKLGLLALNPFSRPTIIHRTMHFTVYPTGDITKDVSVDGEVINGSSDLENGHRFINQDEQLILKEVCEAYLDIVSKQLYSQHIDSIDKKAA